MRISSDLHKNKSMIQSMLPMDKSFDIISRDLSFGKTTAYFLGIDGFVKDDIVLICSDGLTNMVEEPEIYNILKNEGTLAAEKLVEKANENGGYDNITAIVIR